MAIGIPRTGIVNLLNNMSKSVRLTDVRIKFAVGNFAPQLKQLAGACNIERASFTCSTATPLQAVGESVLTEIVAAWPILKSLRLHMPVDFPTRAAQQIILAGANLER